LSSRRSKVTRLGGGFAAAGRAAARSSLGSVSSEIVLMEHLLITLRRSCSGRLSPTFRDRHATDMIAPTAVGCKSHPINTSKGLRFCRTPAKGRVTGSLGTSYCCPTSANRLPCPFEIYDSALTRSFRFRIPQPPAPRGRQDRVYRKGLNPRDWANESWSFSFLGMRRHDARPPAQNHHSTSSNSARGQQVRRPYRELNLPVG